MLQVQEALAEHIPAMSGLLTELFRLEKDFTAEDRSAKQKDGLEMILNRPEGGRLLVLLKEGTVIGMVNLLFTISTAEGGKALILEDYILAETERGKGYGSFFMQEIVRYARERGFLRITLLVDADNEPAQAFYRKAGYEFSNMRCMRLHIGD